MKIIRTQIKYSKKILIGTLAIIVMSSSILFAGVQATFFEFSESSASTVPTVACIQTYLPEPSPIQTDGQHSALSGLLVLGAILGLASIAAYIMERLAANKNNN